MPLKSYEISLISIYPIPMELSTAIEALYFKKFPIILAGTIIAKNGSIYIAARVGERGPKNCDEKTIINTLFIQAKDIAPARRSSLFLPKVTRSPTIW
jgi:hypothetical protein